MHSTVRRESRSTYCKTLTINSLQQGSGVILPDLLQSVSRVSVRHWQRRGYEA
jgi:hypothetical protein